MIQSAVKQNQVGGTSSNEICLSPAKFSAFLAALIVLLFHDVLFGQYSFFYRDFGLFGYPLAHYHKESLWNGEIPLWNPYSNAGLPFLAQWNTLVCYPLSAIYLLLPLPWSLNVFCLFHLWLAGVSMFLLARYWTGSSFAGTIAGTGYAFCGLLQNALMWPNNIAALAWMPLVVMMVDLGLKSGGRQLIWAFLVASIQFLAGAPEVFIFTWVIVGSLWGWERLGLWKNPEISRESFRSSLIRLISITIGMLFITAVQWIPFVDLLVHSHRDSGFSTNAWSMPIWGVANFLVPLFHCSPSLAGVYSQDAQQWTSSYYLGIGLVWLTICGCLMIRQNKKIAVIALLALFGLFMALGEGTIVYPTLKGILPVLGFIRFPIKYVILVTWCLPVLAAFAVVAISQCPKVSLKWIWTVGISLISLIIMVVILAGHHPVPGEVITMTRQSGWSRIGILLGMLLAITVMVQRTNSSWQQIAKWGFLALIAYDGVTHVPNPNPTVKARSMESANQSDSPHLVLGQGRSMISPRMSAFLGYAGNSDAEAVVSGHRNALYPNWNLLSKSPMANGFFSMYLKHPHDVQTLFYAEGESFKDRLANFLGVSKLSSDIDLFTWEDRTHAQPMVTIGASPVFVDDAQSLQMLKDEVVDFSTQVLLPIDQVDRVSALENTNAIIKNIKWLPHSVEIECETDKESLIVVAQSFSSNWKARVNGEEIPVLRANYAFQAVAIPCGNHVVRIYYSDPWFQLGAWLSLISFLGVFFTLIRKPRL